MRGLILLRGLPIAALATSSGDGGEFMATPDPKEVWRAAATGEQVIDVDLGAAIELDTLFLGFTNAAAAATWSIDRTLDMAGTDPLPVLAEAPMRVAGSSGPRQHALARLDAPATSRFLRIRTIQPAASEPMQIGVLLAGLRFEHAYEFKAGRRPIDLSERVDLSGGGFGFGRAAIKSSFRFTFADLSDAELKALWETIKAVGAQEPVLLIEGGDGALDFDQLHYGVFDRFEAYERDDPADTRWALSMQDWI